MGGYTGITGALFGLHVGAVAALLFQVDGGVLHPRAERTALRRAGAEVAVEKGMRVMGRNVRAQLGGTIREAELRWGIFDLLDRFVQGVFGTHVPRGRSDLFNNLDVE